METTLEVRVNISGLETFGQRVRAGLENPGSAGPIREAFEQWAAVYMAEQSARFAAQGNGDWAPLKPSTIARRRQGVKIRRELGVQARLSGLSGPTRKRVQYFINAEAMALRAKWGARAGEKGMSPAEAHANRIKRNRATALARAHVFQELRAGGAFVVRRATILSGATVAILRDTGQLFAALTGGHAGHVETQVPFGISVGIGGGAEHANQNAGGALTIGRLAAIHQEGNPGHKLPARRILVDASETVRQKCYRIMDGAITGLAESA